MPELPEVERGRRLAESVAAGRRIASVECAEDPVVFAGVPAAAWAELRGRRVLAVCRPAALRRALRNLLENAAAYGVRAAARIERDGEETCVVVEDEGPGIPEADLERVFEPFVRLEASRNRDSGGSGLGLAIARSIVRSHGGDIRLENRPEGGVRATVVLPGEE